MEWAETVELPELNVAVDLIVRDDIVGNDVCAFRIIRFAFPLLVCDGSVGRVIIERGWYQKKDLKCCDESRV
jgi:hypothetical protein